MTRNPKPKQVNPPDWDSFVWPSEVILGIDQSLANTGWALIQFAPGRRPHVLAYGTIVTKPIEGLTGFTDSLARGESLASEISILLSGLLTVSKIDRVVHEMPAMMGNAISVKAEGPPIAALAVRLAIRFHQNTSIRMLPVVMMQNQRMKTWVTGDRKATKDMVRAGVWRAIDPFRTNEHVADAMGLVLADIAYSDYEFQVMMWRELTRKKASE